MTRRILLIGVLFLLSSCLLKGDKNSLFNDDYSSEFSCIEDMDRFLTELGIESSVTPELLPKTGATRDPDSTLRAVIMDPNGDGAGDLLRIHFTENFPSIPDSITSIDWPEEGNLNHKVSSENIRFYQDSEGLTDSSTLEVDLQAVLSNHLETQTSQTDPPTLNIYGDSIYQSEQIPIEDGIGPVLEYARYNPNFLYAMQAGDSTVITIKLELIFSEPITKLRDSIDLHNLLAVHSNHPDSTGTIKFLTPLRQPVISQDTLQVRLDTSDLSFLKNDSLSISSHSGFGDYHGNLSPPGYVPVTNASTIIDNTIIFRTVENNDPRVPRSNIGINPTPQWVPPVGLTSTGETEQSCLREDGDPVPIRSNSCLSTVLVLTNSEYIAEVEIFNYDGDKVHASTQSFGYCGELENPARQVPGGIASYLVWNFRDQKGNLVKPSIFTWRVKFTTPSQETFKTYKVGVYCNYRETGQCDGDYLASIR